MYKKQHFELNNISFNFYYVLATRNKLLKSLQIIFFIYRNFTPNSHSAGICSCNTAEKNSHQKLVRIYSLAPPVGPPPTTHPVKNIVALLHCRLQVSVFFPVRQHTCFAHWARCIANQLTAACSSVRFGYIPEICLL